MINETGLLPIIRRWWWLLVLGTAVAAIAAYTVARLESPTYAATATLLVGPLNANYAAVSTAGDLGRTYAEVAKSLPVLKRVIVRSDATLAPADLADDVMTSSNDVTRLVTLKVESSSPQLAASLANALGAELIDLSRTTDAEITDAIREFTGKSAVAQLTTAQQAAIRAAAVSVFGAGISGRLHVIDPAVASDEPVAPNILLLTTLGALAGLALASVVALAISTGDGGRQSGGESLGALDGVRFLGAVEKTSGGVLAVAEGDARVVESYRLLATKIGLLGGRRPVKSLVVIHSDDRRASGAVAANLASVVAEGEDSVLLVDAGCGSVTRLLGLDGRPGYAELVRKGAAHVEAMLDELKIAQSDRLAVLPIGDHATSSLLEGERARRLLAGFGARADIIVFSAPPIDRSPVGLVWGGVADGTVIVVNEGSSGERVTEAASSLELVGANVLGAVTGRGMRIRLRRRRHVRVKERKAA